MKFPPSILSLRIKGESNFSLWLPLFLIWPILLLVALVILPFIFLISLFYLKGNVSRSILIVPASYNLISDLKGLTVEVDNPKNNISIYIK